MVSFQMMPFHAESERLPALSSKPLTAVVRMKYVRFSAIMGL